MGETTKFCRVAVSDLIPYINNAKIHTEDQITRIASSIREFGFLNPVLIDASYNVIAGHGRILAAKKLGLNEVPCLFVEGLTDAQRKAYILADNRLAELAEWDTELLNNELGALYDLDIDMADYGFEMEDAPESAAEVIEDEPPEPPETPRSKPGDLYQLGRHRLMCGDATDADAVDKLMDGNKADICFTSPPYNMGASVGNGWKAPNKAMHGGYAYDGYNDSLSRDEYECMLCDALTNALRASDDALFNIGILAESKTAVIGMMNRFKDQFCDIVIWNKSASMPHGMQSQRGMLSHRCEMIFAFNQNGSRSFTHPQWAAGTGINRIDTANASRNEYSDVHSATFPVEFAFEVLRLFCGKSCLDLFGGTGTTLIAAEQLGRTCYMMELDPHYCDVIIDRWENFTGQKATLLNGQ